jgi:hypothetical protein
MALTSMLTPVEGGTGVDVTAENVADAISREHHPAGMASSLANLAGYVAIARQLSPKWPALHSPMSRLRHLAKGPAAG